MTSSLSLGFGISKAVQTTIFPPIPLAYEWIASYKGSRSLLNMSQGVPGIPPPNPVQIALAKSSSSQSSFGYTQVVGDSSLRTALIGEMKAVYSNNGLSQSIPDVDPDDIALTSGANLGFVATVMCLADREDEIILPVPWYFNHQMALTLLGVRPIPLETTAEDGFSPSVEACSKLITSKTKAIALVTPNNPTGAVYSPSILDSFLDLAKRHNIALILDETYRDFITSGSPHNLFNTPQWRTNLIHIFSFSKSYCLPGHRLGAIAASPSFISGPLTKVLDTLQICAPRPIQLALAPLLHELRPWIKDSALAIETRHHIFRSHLSSNWKIGSQGGYYAFVRHPFQGRSALEVCKRLVQQLGLVVLPEDFFQPDGDEGEVTRWIRFSVANVNDESVKEACARLEEAERTWGWELD